MSAYIVSKGHIRFLVEAAGRLSRDPVTWFHNGRHRQLSRFIKSDTANALTPNQLGALLWEENVRSVDERYREENGVGAYEHVRSSLPIDPIQVFASLRCYEYQSCEHEGWETSEAKAICDAIKDAAIRVLPGSDDTEWGVPAAWEQEDDNKVIALTDLL
jgi:hypothetical protein